LHHVAGAHAQDGGKTSVDAVDTGGLEALADEREAGMAREGAATGAEFDVGHETIRVNEDNCYIAMHITWLETF
jgi:hypothetical protein